MSERRPEDAPTLDGLARAERARVLRFGRRVCAGRADAEDAVQEAFLRLAHRPEVLRSGGALPWLLTVVRNACLRLAGRLARWRPSAAPDEADEAGGAEPVAELTPEGTLARAQEAEAVRVALAALSPPHREILLLRDVEGRSGSETARALGLGLAAMKARLHRARRALGEALRVNVTPDPRRSPAPPPAAGRRAPG